MTAALTGITITLSCDCAEQLATILERLDHMATQADVDTIVAAIDTATTGIRADIDQLKADVAAGNALDFSALDAKVEALAALDAENPPVV